MVRHLHHADAWPHEAADTGRTLRRSFRNTGDRVVADMGTAMTLRAGFLGILMLAATLPAGAGERMTLKVSPAVCFAPANLIVRTMIEADADNRSIEIVAESSDFYRSSQIQLDGDRAPRTSIFEFRSLPPGTYDVTARLFGTGGSERAEVHQQVNVIASGTGY
jgi:hypothetical protein